MFRPLSLYIGLRYTRAKRRTHFISFISMISIAGMALGILALITVLSVMNGFQKELQSRILGMAPHATITEYPGPMKDWQTAADTAKTNPQVTGAAPFINGQGMFTFSGRVQGALIQGILPEVESEVSDLASNMVEGDLQGLLPGDFKVVMGSQLAASLGLQLGDKVTMIIPTANVTLAGAMPRFRRFTLSGIFEVGYQFDSSLALINLSDAQKLFRLKDSVSGVRLRLKDIYQSREIAREVARELDGPHGISDWTREHGNFFAAVQMEKKVMFLILLLIVAVASFNIVSTLVMLVTDKQADIAILRTLGTSPAEIMQIFIVQGVWIGIFGTLLGTIGGVALALNVTDLVAWIEQVSGSQILASDVYYISFLPSELRWMDVITIGCASLVMSFIATLYPAWRASRVKPAEALRYE
ncbi:lipoprotein-releasing ABC transporter permease subunit [Pelagibaculum spongiae]|uniref:Lipoprotein-releasing ABC transporter permease subunit n=1 Tax=Pelagibaculum spongiae TaxID=2080658 RepID=A0A2V1GTF8_9GAMM|nr:lipoprotein-releasing ABC transporter permease subunit [Pelagibaculum spongiae]PVZ68888.1 lipoprotein-releasing ABC transporter permease subunit [Pelagibaculum spongiae]